MDTFGKKMTECRKAKNLSQKELAKAFGTSHTIIGKYERDEMNPCIEAAKKLAILLDTTVGYLLGETEQDGFFKDKKILQRFQDTANLLERERTSLITTIDYFIKAVKIDLI